MGKKLSVRILGSILDRGFVCVGIVERDLPVGRGGVRILCPDDLYKKYASF